MMSVRPFVSGPPCVRAPGRVINWILDDFKIKRGIVGRDKKTPLHCLTWGPGYITDRLLRNSANRLPWVCSFVKWTASIHVAVLQTWSCLFNAMCHHVPSEVLRLKNPPPLCRLEEGVILSQHGWKWLQKPCPVHTQIG